MFAIRKIMLLDDDLEIHQYVSDILENIQEQTCELVAFQNFDDAIAAIEAHDFDLCLVDYLFGDPKERTGIDFIKEAVGQSPYLPCILFTGSASQITALQGVQVGAVDYIDKGNIRPQTFMRVVRYALKRSSTIKELYSLYQQTLITSQFRSEMMRLASHDIKNPLSSIMLSIDMLKRLEIAQNNEQLQKHINRIQSATNRIQSITEDILSLEALSTDEDFEATDLTLLIQSVIRELTIQGELDDKRLIFVPTKNVPDVAAIPGQIREVLHNLLTNAVKYTHSGGHIEIKTEVRQAEICVSIGDDGYGIHSDEIDRLFEPFARIITAETEHIEGSGLGLYLVKQIIQRHNGEVFVDSILDEGSVFGFVLPIVD